LKKIHNRSIKCIDITSIYDAATSECFSFVLAMNISQKTDHHSNRKPPGASIAAIKQTAEIK
jgi:hypothetical protein